MPGVLVRPISRMALVMAFMMISIVDIGNAFTALGCAGTLQRSRWDTKATFEPRILFACPLVRFVQLFSPDAPRFLTARAQV